MMQVTIVPFAEMEALERNVIYVGHVLDVLAKLPPGTLDCIWFSSPYYGCRDYTCKNGAVIVQPVVWDGDPACEHEWSVVVPVRKATPGDQPGPGSRQAARRTAAENRPGKDSKWCVKCGAWFGDMGNEPVVELYISHLVAICKACMWLLKDYGALWVNLGDTYTGSGGAGGRWSSGAKATEGKWRQPDQDRPDRSELLVPYRFAIAMTDTLGVVMPNDIIWYKPDAGMHPDYLRYGNCHEYMFYFVKPNEKPLFYVNKRTLVAQRQKPRGTKGIENVDWRWGEHKDCKGPGKCKHPRCKDGEIPVTLWKPYTRYFNKVTEPFKCPGVRSGHAFGGKKAKNPEYQRPTFTGNEWSTEGKDGRNLRDVWSIHVSRYQGGHTATAPPELPAMALDATCPRQICSKCGLPRVRISKDRWSDCGCGAPWIRGHAMDPFTGVASTFIAVRDCKDCYGASMDIDISGIEISPVYAKLAKERVENSHLEPGQLQLQQFLTR